MRRLGRWIFIAMLTTIAARAGAYTVPYEAWMGAYVGEAKIGYVSFKVDAAEFGGIRGYRIASVMSNRLTVLGADLSQLVTTVVYTDSNYNPLKEEFEMSSGGKTTRVSAVFGKQTIECVISSGDGRSTKSVPIPEGASLVGDAMFAVIDPEPRVGHEYSLHYFNPLTLAVDDLKIRIDRREKVTIGGTEYDTYVLESTSPMGAMTVWQAAGGDVVQVKAVAGITMVRQSKEEAISGISGTTEDFAVLTSVKPNRSIESPRQARALDIILSGFDDPRSVPSDSRQKAREVADKPDAVRIHITAREFDPKKPQALPIRKPDLREHLASTPYIDHDVGAVGAQARTIVGEEKNAYKACAAIRAWLHANLRSRADIGITRSASDVLKSKVGVCRDYAILFAALARSAGVPTKLAAGLVYLDGAFYYHAWVECYVGEWVPFDATQPSNFVDATHIKLAEGDAASMFGLARVIGSLRAEIMSVK